MRTLSGIESGKLLSKCKTNIEVKLIFVLMKGNNMTRLISIKAVSELPEAFKDKVSFQVVDNNVEAVVITLGEETLRIVGTDSYSKNVKVLKTQPKKQVTKYKLSGIVGGLTMQPEMFDSEYEADEKRKSYEYKFNFGEVELKIEPVVEYVDEEKIS